MFDAMMWPEVPAAQRPRDLFYDSSLTIEELDTLAQRGWNAIDVRVLPSTTPAERQYACFAVLQGARNKTIALTKIQLDAIELEMRACGLLSNKAEAPKGEQKLEDMDLEAILGIQQSVRANKGLANQVEAEKKKRGTKKLATSVPKA